MIPHYVPMAWMDQWMRRMYRDWISWFACCGNTTWPTFWMAIGWRDWQWHATITKGDWSPISTRIQWHDPIHNDGTMRILLSFQRCILHVHRQLPYQLIGQVLSLIGGSRLVSALFLPRSIGRDDLITVCGSSIVSLYKHANHCTRRFNDPRYTKSWLGLIDATR